MRLDHSRRTKSFGDDNAVRYRVFQALQERSVVVGRVHSVRSFGVVISISKVLRKRVSRSDFARAAIQGLIHTSELSNTSTDGRSMLKQYAEGDRIRAVVLSANFNEGRVNLTIREAFRPSRGVSLGYISHSDSDEDDAQRRSDQARETYSYNQQLRHDVNYANPYAVQNMARSLGINMRGTMLPITQYARDDRYDRLTEGQSRTWAADCVRKGTAYAKANKVSAAMECYEQALDLDPRQKDAFVARGAALANSGKLREAMRDFNSALAVDPQDTNAQLYLDNTIAKLKAKHSVTDVAPPAASVLQRRPAVPLSAPATSASTATRPTAVATATRSSTMAAVAHSTAAQSAATATAVPSSATSVPIAAPSLGITTVSAAALQLLVQQEMQKKSGAESSKHRHKHKHRRKHSRSHRSRSRSRSRSVDSRGSDGGKRARRKHS
eukprot:TRINITY_DN7028_c0_g1_i3.p1 TRINITY_DN7028_c0_g1~~TRINITY_DN7028_c0_g1_i3.p1  ORF type:complete len:440 (-),score=69.35 TRINITY_DN7028_c0_g1_i3:75-1394(-)